MCVYIYIATYFNGPMTKLLSPGVDVLIWMVIVFVGVCFTGCISKLILFYLLYFLSMMSNDHVVVAHFGLESLSLFNKFKLSLFLCHHNM